MSINNYSDNPINYITYININGTLQENLSTNREYLSTYSDTGILTFNGLEISGATTINVGYCNGWIVNNESDALFPIKTYVEFSGETNVPVTTITGDNESSFVFLTSAATITFSDIFPTSSQRKEALLLGRINHPIGTINSVFDKPDFNISPNSQIRDLYKILNLINSGLFVSFNGPNLNLDLEGGVIYGYGINYINDKSNPNSYIVSSAATVSFAYRTQTGGTSSFVSLIDPTNYDVDGVITPISGDSGQATIQYVYYIPGNGIGIQFGQTVYSSLREAVLAIGKENSFIRYNNLDTNGVLVGLLALTKGATSLNDSSQARFIKADKFGQAIGIAGGLLNDTDVYTTGTTTVGNTVYFDRNDMLSAYTLTFSSVTPTDYYTTGLTFNPSNYDLTVSLNNGSAYTQNLSILASDVTITGGSYDSNTGNVTFINNTGGTFNVSGFTTGMTDTFTTGGTFDNNTDTIIFTKNNGTNYAVTGITDIYITGSSFSNNNLNLTNNSGVTVTTLIDNFSGLTVSGVTFNKLLLEKVGSVSGSLFSGSPKTYNVIFNTNFPNTNYAITLGGEVERSWYSSNKTISGFTINAGANTAFSGLAYYIAKENGEV